MTHRDHIESGDSVVRRAVSVALTEGADEARRSIRSAVLDAARSDARWMPFGRLSRRAAAALVAVTLVGSGASAAVAAARPGSAAYVLKRAAERLALEAVPSGALEDALQAHFAQCRAAEIRELLRSGLDEQALQRALDSMGVSAGRSEGGQGSAEDALKRELEQLEGGSGAQPSQDMSGGGRAGIGAPSPGPVDSSASGGGSGGGSSSGGGSRDGAAPQSPSGGSSQQERSPDSSAGPGTSGSTDATGGAPQQQGPSGAGGSRRQP
ncbi:MAG: hypothetical protein QMC94_03755 [Anaerosomatales bacterium]|nr:hypothetical protein [Anaerosomatales bacterium]